MDSRSWIRATLPALSSVSDAELLSMFQVIERESGVYILGNVCAVWLLTFMATGQIAEFLGIEFFRSFGGWALILGAFMVAALVSRSTHR